MTESEHTKEVQTFFEREVAGPAVVDIMDGDQIQGTYLAAEMFLTTDGIAWADAGWPATPASAFHRVVGVVRMTGTRQARVADAHHAFEITPVLGWMPETIELASWRAAAAKYGITRDQARATLVEALDGIGADPTVEPIT